MTNRTALQKADDEREREQTVSLGRQASLDKLRRMKELDAKRKMRVSKSPFDTERE
jgi:hypothetical protein